MQQRKPMGHCSFGRPKNLTDIMQNMAFVAMTARH